MGTAGINLVRNVEVKDVVRSLDRFYCYNLAVMHWAEALANRLEGPAAEFSLPASFSDVGTILRYAAGQVRVIIRDYGAFLDWVRGNDELSYRLVLGLLGDEVHREAEIEAALEDGRGPAGPDGRGPGG